jgi:membrane protein
MYEFEPDCLRASHSFKRLAALRIAHLVTKNFSQGLQPLTAADIGHRLEAPIRLVRQMLFELVDAGVLSEIKIDDYKEAAYQPARDVCSLTIKDVVDALEGRGVEDIPVVQSKDLQALAENLSALRDSLSKSPANKVLKDI